MLVFVWFWTWNLQNLSTFLKTFSAFDKKNNKDLENFLNILGFFGEILGVLTYGKGVSWSYLSNKMKKHLTFFVCYSLWAGSIIWVLRASWTSDETVLRQEASTISKTCKLAKHTFKETAVKKICSYSRTKSVQ